MVAKQFNLRFVFVCVTIMCALIWAVSAPSPTTWIAIVVIASLASAIRGQLLSSAPIRCGAGAGAAAVTLLICSYWPVLLGGYFFHEAPWPYFEDGFVVTAFLYPVAYVFVYAPVGAAIGAICGITVLLLWPCRRAPSGPGTGGKPDPLSFLRIP
jgi:hypothetical protein